MRRPCPTPEGAGARFPRRGREPCRPRPAPGEVRMGCPPPHPHHFLPGRGAGGGGMGEGWEATGEGVQRNGLRFRVGGGLPGPTPRKGTTGVNIYLAGSHPPQSAPSWGAPSQATRTLPAPPHPGGPRRLLPAPSAACFTPIRSTPLREPDPVGLPTGCRPTGPPPPRLPQARGPAPSSLCISPTP